MESRALGRVALLLLGAVAWTLYLLPNRVRLALGRGMGLLLRAVGMRAQVIRQNLEYAFPGEEARSRRESLFRSAYGHLGNLLLEILFLFGPMRRFVAARSRLQGLENWRAANAQGDGVIFLASHVGNWEIMAATGALAGMPLMLVTKHLKPEWLHQAIERGRARCQVQATYEPRTLRDVLKHLKAGGTVGFVLDQYAGPPVGVRVPVFGIPVGTTSAVATLAKRTGAVVLPVVNYRMPNGDVHVEIRPPLAWESKDDPQLELGWNTARYARAMEADIHAYPAQWLWTHRRFKGDLSPLREGEWTQKRTRH